MQFTDDMELLRDYATRGSEPAFETLVRRHVNLVYSAAVRRVGDPVLAGEVTQTVFIILAKKARSLRPATILSGWLYRTAQLAAGNALRAACRRRKHEEEAAQMQIQEPEPPDSSWDQIAPFLEDAMAHLGEADRNVVVLRYFENKDFKTVGAALGTSEDTAQKRAARAVEKLRVFLTKRGVILPVVAVTAALSAHAVQAAPAGVVASAAAAAAQGTAATTTTTALLKGTLKLMAWTKLKTAAVVGVALLLAASATTTVKVREIRARPDYWQVTNFNYTILENARPQITILPSKFNRDYGWTEYPLDGKMMGIGVTADEMIEAVFLPMRYGVTYFKTRTVLEVPLPQDRYDFIASLDQGASNALQRAISDKFGLTLSRQTRATNVLVLSARNPNVPGLKPATSPLQPGSASIKNGHFSATNSPIQDLAFDLEAILGVPVIDQTGLTGELSCDVKWDEPDPKQRNLAAFKQAFSDQLGLDLTPEIQPIEMLVIEKAGQDAKQPAPAPQ